MVSSNSAYCLTNTIDNSSTVGNRYYHNIKNNTVIMRPRLPLRYDFNDIEIVRMPLEEETLLKRHYRLKSDTKLFRVKRTLLNIINTGFLYFLLFLLVFVSIVNMKNILQTMQGNNMSVNDKWLFRVAFILSFIVVWMLLSYFVLSMFELYRNQDFSEYFSNGIRFKNLKYKKSPLLRVSILLFVLICLILSMAEILNLFFMKENPNILILFAPATLGVLFLIQMYVFATN